MFQYGSGTTKTHKTTNERFERKHARTNAHTQNGRKKMCADERNFAAKYSIITFKYRNLFICILLVEK